MIKTSFSYFIHCSNLQKLNMLYICTTRKEVLIIFASLKKTQTKTAFQYRILKHQHEENTKYFEQS